VTVAERFKQVNDTLGHAVGDLLLREVAQHLSLTVRESDTLARLGGELVSAIIGMAPTMRKHVIAEGVETEAQRAQLMRFGCHEAQGFLFSKPAEQDVFAHMLMDEAQGRTQCLV
jgi:diguanylate cyclase (GGDEF)-like protein